MDQDLTPANPLISIITCTYNRAEFIEEAIRSALSQSYTNWELLIIDDGSTDNTAQIIKTYLGDVRIAYHKLTQRGGISAARNHGLNLAKGTYLATLDSDDVWLTTDKLAQQVQFLESHPGHLVVGTWIKLIDQTSKTIKEKQLVVDDTTIRQYLLLSNQLQHSSTLCRLNSIRQAGGYSSEFGGIIEDYALWLKLGTIGKLANLSNYSTAYRLHPHNTVKEQRQKLLGYELRLIKQYKKLYPHYWLGWLKRHIQLLLTR